MLFRSATTNSNESAAALFLSPAEYNELKRLTHERLEQREDDNELHFLQQHYVSKSSSSDKSKDKATTKNNLKSRRNNVKNNSNNSSSVIQQQYPQHYKYIQNRIYHLQLLQRARLQHQRHGRGPQGTDDAPSSGAADTPVPLSPKEQMELRRFNEQRQQDIHDMNEYYKLKKEMMTNKNNPKMKKQQLSQLKQRFYELELYYKRRVGIKLTQKELYDVQYYTMKRIDDKCDMMEYQKILNQRMEGGGGGTTDRKSVV